MDTRNPSTDVQFKVGNTYTNNVGQYKVLDARDSTVRVKYSDGTVAILTVSIQQKIMARSQRQTDEVNRRKMLAEAQERDRKERAPAMLKADIEEGFFATERPEPEHMGRCSKTGSCPVCTGTA